MPDLYFFSSNLHLCVWTFVKARQVFCKMSSKTLTWRDTWTSLHWTFGKVAVCFVCTGTLQNSLLFMGKNLTECLWEIHWRERGKKKKERERLIKQQNTTEAGLQNPYTTSHHKHITGSLGCFHFFQFILFKYIRRHTLPCLPPSLSLRNFILLIKPKRFSSLSYVC